MYIWITKEIYVCFVVENSESSKQTKDKNKISIKMLF
jgi:hypothetical protein